MISHFSMHKQTHKSTNQSINTFNLALFAFAYYGLCPQLTFFDRQLFRRRVLRFRLSVCSLDMEENARFYFFMLLPKPQHNTKMRTMDQMSHSHGIVRMEIHCRYMIASNNIHNTMAIAFWFRADLLSTIHPRTLKCVALILYRAKILLNFMFSIAASHSPL